MGAMKMKDLKISKQLIRNVLEKDTDGIDNVDKLLDKLNEIQKSIEGIIL